MNIVFTYHNGDAELALLSAKAMVAMGMNMRHKAIVCATESTALIPQITEELRKVFPEVNRIIAQDGFNGWPLGPNQMFVDASTHCYRYEDPWYFWEPDCVPMVEGWVDRLDEEFKKQPNKIMGSIVGGGMAASGKNVYQLLVGSAVYPAKFLDYCGLAASLCNYNVAYRQAGTIPEPWDVRCRWVFMQNGRNTDLIKAYWKSCNYQYNGNDLVFFAEGPEAQEIQSVTCPDRKVDPQAIVVHGCKDGSLHKMAIAGFLMPSDSTGLESIPDQECDFLYASVGDEIEISYIPVRDSLQNVNNDALSPTVCNKTSDKMRNSPDMATKGKAFLKRKNNSPSKANKPQAPEEFIKQLRALADNLKKPVKKKKKKTERPAQDAV